MARPLGPPYACVNAFFCACHNAWVWIQHTRFYSEGYVFTRTSQMASIGVIFTSTYHTKQLNPWPNSSASRVVNYRRLSACQGDIQPFEGDPYTRVRLTSLRNRPQQKQPGQLSASIPGWIVSQHVQLSFDGEKCVLLLCAWKPAFLRSGHIYELSRNGNHLKLYMIHKLAISKIFDVLILLSHNC